MKRAQIYLDDEQWVVLRRLSKTFGEGVSELVRRAVDKSYRAGYNPDELLRVLRATQGMWKHRKDIKNGVTYENRLRRQWRKRLAGD